MVCMLMIPERYWNLKLNLVWFERLKIVKFILRKFNRAWNKVRRIEKHFLNFYFEHDDVLKKYQNTQKFGFTTKTI